MSGDQSHTPPPNGADDQGQSPSNDGAGGPTVEAEIEIAARIQQAVAAALAEQRESVLRAQAEVQNMRRRCESDVEKAHKFALEKFSGELLPVLDNLERALRAVPDAQREQVRSLYEGVELTLKGFAETLARFQIRQVNPVGEPFDPQLHQAIAQVPNPSVAPNSVLEVMQKGYTLNGRVLRAAMVVVSRAP
ncbi:MAG: nucleotide exchange factor GrpE [Pseudohongiellaceae bacterium]